MQDVFIQRDDERVCRKGRVIATCGVAGVLLAAAVICASHEPSAVSDASVRVRSPAESAQRVHALLQAGPR